MKVPSGLKKHLRVISKDINHPEQNGVMAVYEQGEGGDPRTIRVRAKEANPLLRSGRERQCFGHDSNYHKLRG